MTAWGNRYPKRNNPAPDVQSKRVDAQTDEGNQGRVERSQDHILPEQGIPGRLELPDVIQRRSSF